MHYLTLGTVWKNEQAYARPFVEFHRKVGVEKFVIFDREYNQIKEMFKDDPDVEVIHFPDIPKNVHIEGWNQLIKYNKGKTKFLCLIDADQCLVPVKHNDVKEILKNYEDVASLQINWSTFGSGGQDKMGPEPVYERFLKRAKFQEGINNHCQFICQPNIDGIYSSNPHYCHVPRGQRTVNTNKQDITGSFNIPPLHDTLYVAHYWSKSREEFMIKTNKGRCDIFGEKMPLPVFDANELVCNAEEDRSILEIWKR